MLLITACTAGYFAGYSQVGGAPAPLSDGIGHTTIVYTVADLITPADAPLGWSPDARDFDPLICLITTTVASETWTEDNGAAAEITPLPRDGAIAVSTTDSTHAELLDFFHTARTYNDTPPERCVERVRSVIARKQLIETPVAFVPTAIPSLRAGFARKFDAAVRVLVGEHGPPDAAFKEDDPGFPTWSTAKRIAFWRRDDGQFYVCLADQHELGEAILAGWRAGDSLPVSELQ